MTYEIYQYIFYGSLIMCIIMLVLSIILFFVFKIPKIVGFLTGATARKAIKSINEHTEKSMSQRLKQTTVLKQRGNETTVLLQMSSLEETSVLNNKAGTDNGSEPKEFAIIYDITYIWTDEIIN